MSKRKVTVVRKDQNGKNRKFNIDLGKLPDDILSALEGIDIQQSTLMSKNQKAKSKKTMPSPRDAREKSIDLGEGLDNIYGKKPLSNQEDYPEGLNPFASALQQIKPSAIESKRLNWFKSEVVKAKSVGELSKVVNQALAAGIRINACHEGEWSFAEYVILDMHLHKFTKGDQKKIIRQLMLSGANFHDTMLQNKLVSEICNELQPEVQPQVDKRLEERRKAGENAAKGGNIIGVEMDNATTLMEFSKGSIVEVAKALEGIGLNKSNIIKIDNGKLEVRCEEGGARNYIDLSDNSGKGFTMMLNSSIGKLRIRLCHDKENHDRVQVKVEDKELWNELQEVGGVITDNCLFGGMAVKEAVEKGSFTRSGMWSEKQVIKETKEETLSSWVDRVRGQETFRVR